MELKMLYNLMMTINLSENVLFCSATILVWYTYQWLRRAHSVMNS